MPYLVPSLPLPTVISLINEWGSVPKLVSVRPWKGYPGPESIFRVEFDAYWGRGADMVTDNLIVQAADTLYPLFALPNAQAKIRSINQLCAQVELTPRLPDAEHTGLAWQVPHSNERLLAAMLAPLLLAAASEDVPRLGVCNAQDCADAYVDGSPTHNRTYCSTRCQTRERVRAFRSRHRNTGSGRETRR